MSLLLRLILLMDLLGPNGLNPPVPASQPSPPTANDKVGEEKKPFSISGRSHLNLSNNSFPSSGSSSAITGGSSAVTGSSSRFFTGSISTLSSGMSATAAVAPRLQHNTFAESLQWVVADSQAVLRARFETETDDHEVAFTVLETIKGTPKTGETIKLYALMPKSALGGELLLFLQANKSPTVGANPLRMRWNSDMSYNALALDGNSEVVLMDYSRINQGKIILEAAKQAAAFPSADPPKKLDLSTYGTPNGRFANMRLVVPIDSRLEKLAQQWASEKEFDLRLVGLEAIRPFKSQKNIEIVTALLDDTRSRNPSKISKWQMAFYDVRAEAADVLRNWEVSVPQLPDSGPVLQYRRLSISSGQIAIIASIVVAWCALFYLLARLSRSRNMDLGFWRLNFTAISLLLAAFAGWIWIRSYLHIDELMFPFGQTQHQIASCNGGIQYVVVREWTLPSIIVTGHFDQQLVEDQWSIDRLNHSAIKGSMGFISTNGLVNGPARIIHPFSLFRIPYWILVVPLTLVLAMALFRIVRVIIRFKRGLCRHCGYDLRESRGGQCPECGTESPTRTLAPHESLLHHV